MIFLAAKLAAELCERIRQPAVIGELLAGALIGPYALGLVGRADAGLIDAFHVDSALAQEAVTFVYHLLAELGVVVLLFFVGLETRVYGTPVVSPPGVRKSSSECSRFRCHSAG